MISGCSARRLRAALRRDIVLQYRNGFYYAAAFVAGLLALLLSRLPILDGGRLLPVLVLGNLVISTFYFIAGLVLLEKAEGSLEPQVVSPLRTGEYLAAKVISLSGLALAENLAIVIIVNGLNFRPLPLLLGAVLAAAFYILLGFIAVARYDSINEYLFPSMLYALFFALPVLSYFNLWESWLVYLHPLQAPLLLLQAAFRPIEFWQWVYGLLYASVWIALVFYLSQNAFHRFVVTRQGVR